MEHACVPGSSTTPGRPSTCVGALGHIAFRYTDSVGTQNHFSIAAQWLACTFPCRRFADILADACARLGADVVRYSFIVVDLYGAFEVKHLFHGILHFLPPSFFVRLGIPFLRPDPHVLDAGARRGCQGRPSLGRGFMLHRFQAAS
jgi:hypothetical protein